MNRFLEGVEADIALGTDAWYHKDAPTEGLRSVISLLHRCTIEYKGVSSVFAHGTPRLRGCARCYCIVWSWLAFEEGVSGACEDGRCPLSVGCTCCRPCRTCKFCFNKGRR